MAIKKGDFVEVEYTGSLKEEGIVFDTTDEKKAKDEGIHNPSMKYGPITICVGEAHLVKGLDGHVIGKEAGTEFDADLTAEDAFGKKSAKLIQLIPLSKFKKQDINPMPGLQVNIDGNVGMVKTVSGGRVMVDFNHPLSGKDIRYHIKLNKVVEDDAEKLKALMKLQLNSEDIEVELKEGNATVKTKMKLPPGVGDMILEGVQKLIPSVKKLEFKE